jgi:dihydroneopterin aldolase/2-amino-4-hydroxy-6-hydroxymethyldihydropteridine diphosphokinase
MDKITITGLKFYANHGVLKTEKEQGQYFIIDCAFYLDTSLTYDEIANTVNYGELSCAIVEFSKTNTFNLLETLANKLAEHLLIKYPLIKKLTLTIHKPQAPIPVHFTDVALKITRQWSTCYLSIGSNLGNRVKNLDLVSSEILKTPQVKELKKSNYLETKPYGVLDQPNFLNAALKIKTIFTINQLLDFCQSIEKKAKRVKTRKWGERTLDVDILLYGEKIIFTPKIIIPHPEMTKRTFVLEPLKEIEPYLIHPIKKESIATLYEKIKNN